MNGNQLSESDFNEILNVCKAMSLLGFVIMLMGMLQ